MKNLYHRLKSLCSVALITAKQSTSSTAWLTIMEVLISRITHSRREQLSSLWHFRWAHLSAFARGSSYSRLNERAGKTASKQKTAAIVGILRSAAYLTGKRTSSVITSSTNVGLLFMSFVSHLHLYNSWVTIYNREHWWNRVKQRGT